MKKRILLRGEFFVDVDNNSITFVNDILIQDILLVTDISNNIIIYNFACDGFGGTLSNKTLTFEYQLDDNNAGSEYSVIINDRNSEEAQQSFNTEENTSVLQEILKELQTQTEFLKAILE